MWSLENSFNALTKQNEPIQEMFSLTFMKTITARFILYRSIASYDSNTIFCQFLAIAETHQRYTRFGPPFRYRAETSRVAKHSHINVIDVLCVHHHHRPSNALLTICTIYMYTIICGNRVKQIVSSTRTHTHVLWLRLSGALYSFCVSIMCVCVWHVNIREHTRSHKMHSALHYLVYIHMMVRFN